MAFFLKPVPHCFRTHSRGHYKGFTLPAERVKQGPRIAGTERTIDFPGEPSSTRAQMHSVAPVNRLVETDD